MYLQFRTERNINGHCNYLAIDTEKRVFSISPRSWISKDIPVIRKQDIKRIKELAEKENYKEVSTL